jgi:predicted regulator of Ras-like GTPase activity (Roadblock/LC7/MglB family)
MYSQRIGFEIMLLDKRRTALATQCLWSLQEAATEIEGLLLTQIDGLAWTTTLQGDDSTQRLAAVSTAMFLLGEEASEAWGSGESMEVYIKLTADDSSETAVRYVLMRPISFETILIVVCISETLPKHIHDYLDKAAEYLQEVIKGNNPPSPVWNEE